jgi:MoaA/NifB/PqqE/SkfB family radical SAM enzyme
VTFTGGEPSVRPDIGDILQCARRQGLMIQLLTNVTRITPSFTDLLHEVGVSQIHVSIYGATEAVYERMTSVPGSYRQFRQGMLHLPLPHYRNRPDAGDHQCEEIKPADLVNPCT